MIVTMKKLEQQCRVDTERFKKNWEFYCVAGDSWLQGFRYALQLAAEANRENPALDPADILALGSDKVEIEIPNGEHQIGAKINDAR